MISRSATYRRSSLAGNFVICDPPRGERVLFSMCRLVSPFSDVTPSLCLFTAASSPLRFCSCTRHCSLRVGGSTVHGRGIAVAAGTRFPRVHPHALAVLFSSSSTSPPLTYAGILGVCWWWSTCSRIRGSIQAPLAPLICRGRGHGVTKHVVPPTIWPCAVQFRLLLV